MILGGQNDFVTFNGRNLEQKRDTDTIYFNNDIKYSSKNEISLSWKYKELIML